MKSLNVALILFILILLPMDQAVAQAVSQSWDSAGNSAQTVQPVAVHSPSAAGFFETFIKTPFALSVLAATFFGVCISAIFEFFYNLFSGFHYQYPTTKQIWNIGWDQVVAQWWWQPGVTWHLVVSIIVWAPFTLSRYGNRERRKRRKEREEKR